MSYPLVVLASGRGSNAQAILEAERQGQLGGARVIHLFSDREAAGVLKLGEVYQVRASYLWGGTFKTKFSHRAESQWAKVLKDLGTQLVVLAGFMRVLKGPLLEAFPRSIINLHPSLLPCFPGLNAIGQALEGGVSQTGCTVHFVNETLDGGEIIDQRQVPVYPQDTLETLEKRVKEAEHVLLPEVIARLAQASI